MNDARRTLCIHCGKPHMGNNARRYCSSFCRRKYLLIKRITTTEAKKG